MAKKQKEFWKYFKRHYAFYVMLVIPLIYYLVFKYIPMGGLVIAFEDYNLRKGIFGSEWVGLKNFQNLFKMSLFWRAVRNTFLLNSLDLLLGFPIPIILALLLNEFRDGKIKKIIQTVIYLPHFISWIVVGGIAVLIFGTQDGLINIILRMFGFDSIPFLTDSLTWVGTYQFMGIWKNAGWGVIVYLASIAGIDQEQYEAARVDGCSRFKMMYKITLPNILPTIAIMLILKMGGMASIGFDQPYALGNTTVSDVSQVISTYSYYIGFNDGKFDSATALGLFQGIINFVLVVLSNKISSKLSGEALW